MILSVSRRTDIPAFYSEWFFNRIKAGYVDVRNPMNIRHISRINIRPDVVDCIVFWTKNASAMLGNLELLDYYKYYFQYTINPYNKLIEEYVPTKKDIIDNFRLLSKKIGANRVIWRYDPIFFTDEISIKYHIRYFEELAKRLSGYTERCVISFVDLYKKTILNTKNLNIREPSNIEMHKLARELAYIASKYDITLLSCSEKIDLENYGVKHGCCVDRCLIERIVGYSLDVRKDMNQRKECGCVQSIDLGAYNTCHHACKYCYANFNNKKVQVQSQLHDPLSSLLIGNLRQDDIVEERKVASLKIQTLFD